jgi:ABC-2 type transport system ATP-binding protein
MSVSINSVSKNYGSQKALDKVSFEVSKGEILGFLGPNGAGKSTLMKIVTTFIAPTEGAVSVCGFDTSTHSMEVRRRVGYLPEHNPLYLDMYVREYLGFIAGLHGIKRPAERVKKMVELTGLGLEQGKKIGALSKGYRQRVGLAQALIHDPEVLILDEPTSGLDPNQLAEIRNLIRSVGKEKTLMFSTHILQEVEAICDRVVIINRGKIVADGKAQDLGKNSRSSYCIVVEFDKEVLRNELNSIVGITKASKIGEYKWELFSNEQDDIRPKIFKFAVEKDLTVLTINRVEQNLESIFRDLTSSPS